MRISSDFHNSSLYVISIVIYTQLALKHLIYCIKSEINEFSNNIAPYDKVKDD